MAGYVLMGVLGVGLLMDDDGPDKTPIAALTAALLLVIAVGGLVMISFGPWFENHRPDPVLATAPSGAPATFFPRSWFRIVLSVVLSVALAGWLVAAAGTLYGSGHAGWALLVVVLALVLLWPVAVVATGKVQPGGLWLTPTGLEHRDAAVSWAVPWPDVRAVVAAEPVQLELRPDAEPTRSRTVRWIWDQAGRIPAGRLGFASSDLAGGGPQIVAMIAYYLAEPPLREQLGTAESLEH